MKNVLAALLVALFAEALGANGFAPGLTFVTSASNAAPTAITSLAVKCPASGLLVVTGSGESAAKSNFSGDAFVGLAYSIARDSTATDNTNVVQSSALAVFNGDANRDFLNVQRVDACTPGANHTYTLTAYATTPQTSIASGSFVWNGRLIASRGPASSSFAASTTFITSASNASPTIVTTLPVQCPASGMLAITGSGESAARSNFAGNAFIGLAYSIARDSVATDNGNVVQSSALAVFNGDANRDFLNIQRIDSCIPGLINIYRLTAYATTPQTGIANESFVWNGRLTASTLPVVTGFAPGVSLIDSAINAAPTVVTSVSITCPASGMTVVTGSGESAAKSNFDGDAFIGLAYSIARDSTATDNGNVVQSSALAAFNGDANRDFLNVQRPDTCTPGQPHTYFLTAYATTPQTSIANGSFVWNGRISVFSVVNIPPVANAGSDQIVTVGSVAVLDGSGSADGDGDPLAFAWSITSAPSGSTATLVNPTSSNPSLTPDVVGSYTIQLIVHDGITASAPDSVVVTAQAAPGGGALVNGALHTGTIATAGEIDTWTFTANSGERIAVHIGEITDNNDFRPWIRLLAPNATTLGNTSGLDAAAFGDVIAPASGTYQLLVGSFDSGFDGTGTYRLTMTHTPGPITVTAGDQGGPLTNGAMHTGEILQGDLDVWTFTANSGERIAVHIGEITDTDDFRPWIRVWAPNGATLGSASGLDAAEIGDVIAPVTGTYLVLVGSFDSGFDGTGTYRLTMTHTPGPITVSAGDDGGPLTAGAMHTGEILQGDLDVWTFTATAGERIGVHIGEITDTDDFRPWIRVWAPNGATLGSTSGLAAAEIGDVIAPSTGTYLVLVGSFDSGFDGTGTYRLTMTKAPGTNTVLPGDQGGPLSNGAMHTGEILQGDLDVWTFNATAGDRMAVHIGEITDNNDFRPWIRVWAPNGATLGSASGLAAAEIGDVIAPVTGFYLVLVSSFDSGFDGTGTYRLTMTKTPGPVGVVQGDQGGPITTNGAMHTGEILQGDLDVWTFSATAGQNITAHLGELTDNNDFRPWIRVWAPNGATLGSIAGTTTAQIGPVVAPVNGTYLVLVGSFDSGFDGTGTYSLIVNVSP